jgi:D-alanyl-D-alanine carboxypeptidase
MPEDNRQVGDMLKFAQALMEHKLLGKQHTDELLRGRSSVDPASKTKYAYGFEDNRSEGSRWVGHNGGAPGMSGTLRIYPDSGYVSVVLSNLDPPAAMDIDSFIADRLPVR